MVRSLEEIAKMRRAGRVVAEMHECCIAAARPGVTTAEIDRVAREVLERRGARSNFLNYGPPDNPFPAVICTSPNGVIVHGIPGPYRLREGDILSLDCGAIIEGYHGDAAVTIPIGEISVEAQKLLAATRQSLEAGIERIREGNRLYEEQTEPLIAWYMGRDKLVSIDGVGPAERVTARIVQAIDSRMRHA